MYHIVWWEKITNDLRFLLVTGRYGYLEFPPGKTSSKGFNISEISANIKKPTKY